MGNDRNILTPDAVSGMMVPLRMREFGKTPQLDLYFLAQQRIEFRLLTGGTPLVGLLPALATFLR